MKATTAPQPTAQYKVTAPLIQVRLVGSVVGSRGTVPTQYSEGATLPAWVLPEDIQHLLAMNLIEAI